jgi:hypothetical protein
MDLSLIGLVAASGWASGVNLYAAVGLLGVFGRTGLGEVPDVLQRTDVIAVALGLFALEFVADKIPWFDSFWDVAHTVIRPLGAAALGAVLAGDAESVPQAFAALGAGGLASAAHVAKATTRLAINTSPEPATNIGASLIEDGLVLGVIWFAVTNPVLALVLVVVLLIAGTALTIVLVGAARRALRARRERRQGRGRGGGQGRGQGGGPDPGRDQGRGVPTA